MSKESLYSRIRRGSSKRQNNKVRKEDEYFKRQKERKEDFEHNEFVKNLGENKERIEEGYRRNEEYNKERKRKEEEQKKQWDKDGITSDEKLKIKLYKSAEHLKGLPNARELITREAVVNGISEDELEEVVNEIIEKLDNMEKGKHGDKLGIGHDANKQFKNLVKAITSMKY